MFEQLYVDYESEGLRSGFSVSLTGKKPTC